MLIFALVGLVILLLILGLYTLYLKNQIAAGGTTPVDPNAPPATISDEVNTLLHELGAELDAVNLPQFGSLLLATKMGDADAMYRDGRDLLSALRHPASTVTKFAGFKAHLDAIATTPAGPAAPAVAAGAARPRVASVTTRKKK